MKHLLNDLSNEEKNRIREQYEGGMSVDTSKFKKLVETKLGDAKPFLNENNPLGQKIASDAFSNVSKTIMWEPIVGQFSKDLKKSLEIPQTSISNYDGKGILSGSVYKTGTLQNGGTSISYEKIPEEPFVKENQNEGISKYTLVIDASYSQTNSDNKFRIDINLKAEGKKKLNFQEGDNTTGTRPMNSSLKFTLYIIKNDSGKISYEITPGNFVFNSDDSPTEYVKNYTGKPTETDTIVFFIEQVFYKTLVLYTSDEPRKEGEKKPTSYSDLVFKKPTSSMFGKLNSLLEK